jgi:hypothetical protein
VVSVTFNNISVVSWWSVSFVKETGVPGENHDLPRVSDTFYHILLYRVHLAISLFYCSRHDISDKNDDFVLNSNHSFLPREGVVVVVIVWSIDI